MNGSIWKIIAIALLMVGYNVQAQTSKNASDSKNVTEIVVSGQQHASNWFRVESPHFVVYSDTSRDNVNKLLNKLERLDRLLQLYTNGEDAVASTQKLTLYYLNNFSDLHQLVPQTSPYAIGFYNSCVEGVQGFNARIPLSEKNSARLEKQPENEGLAYIFEAYARHFIYHNSKLRTPNWYIDGFAQYFASTRFSDTETVVGMAPEAIRDYLGSVHSTGRYDSLDYHDIIKGNDSSGTNLAGVDGVRLEFQAKSWVLTHYILSSSENIQHFKKYVVLVTQGAEVEPAFEQAFGFKVAQLSKMLWRYKWQAAQAIKANLGAGDQSDFSFEELPQAASNLLLANAAAKSCPDNAGGVALLQGIANEAKKFPGSDYAQMSLSRAQINWGNAQDALGYLTTKTQNDKSDAEAFYLLGRAQMRMAETSAGDSQKKYLDAAQTNLLRSCSLAPQSAESFYAYFKTGLLAQEKPSEETLGSMILAWKLGREVSGYTKYAALTYAYLGQKENAQEALDMLASNQRDKTTAAWARLWLGKLNAGIDSAHVLAEMRAPAQPDARFMEWTYANAEVMNAVATAAGLSNANNVLLDQQQSAQMPPSQPPVGAPK